MIRHYKGTKFSIEIIIIVRNQYPSFTFEQTCLSLQWESNQIQTMSMRMGDSSKHRECFTTSLIPAPSPGWPIPMTLLRNCLNLYPMRFFIFSPLKIERENTLTTLPFSNYPLFFGLSQ